LAVVLSCIIDIALNLRNHSLSLSRRHAALASVAVIEWADAASLSEVEGAGEQELGARAVAVVQDGAGAIHSEVQGAAVAVLGDGAVALNLAGLAGDLGVNEGLGNAA
jgi:hypothetical protein